MNLLQKMNKILRSLSEFLTDDAKKANQAGTVEIFEGRVRKKDSYFEKDRKSFTSRDKARSSSPSRRSSSNRKNLPISSQADLNS